MLRGARRCGAERVWRLMVQMTWRVEISRLDLRHKARSFQLCERVCFLVGSVSA